MSLTVPTAGVSGGRAAELQFEAPQTGNVIRAFGERVKELGDRLESERLDLEMSRLQVDMTRDLGQLRLKYENMGDPEAIEAGWGSELAALKQSYLSGRTETGRARIDPKLRERWELGFDDLAERHAFALGTKVLALRRSQSVATYIEREATTAQAMIGVDPATRATLAAQNDATIDELVLKGAFSPEAGAAAKLKFRQEGDFNAAVDDLSRDPELLRAGLDGNAYPDLTPEGRAKLEGFYAAALDKQAKAAEAGAAKIVAAQAAELREGIAIMKAGQPWKAVGKLDDPAYAAANPELWAEARQAQWLLENGKNIAQMTVAELEALKAEITAPGFDRSWQVEPVALIDKQIAETEKAWATNGIAAAKAADLPVPELADFDPANPGAFAKSLAERAAFAGWAETKGYAEAVPLVDEAEAARLKALVGPNADPAARVALASALVAGGGGRGEGAARAAGASDVFLFAMGLINEGRDASLAEAMLRGDSKIVRQTVILPSDKDMTMIFDEITGGLFGSDPAANDEVFAAARALYADGATGIDPEQVKDSFLLADGAARRQFAAAVQMVLGGSADANGNLTIGGIQEVAGGMVVLPAGVSQQAANDAWDNLGKQLRGRVWDPKLADWPRGPEGATDVLRGLKAASIGGGQVPDLGPDPYLTYLNGLQIEAYGPDLYVLWYPNRAGQKTYIENGDGKTFTLSMRALLKATRQ